MAEPSRTSDTSHIDAGLLYRPTCTSIHTQAHPSRVQRPQGTTRAHESDKTRTCAVNRVIVATLRDEVFEGASLPAIGGAGPTFTPIVPLRSRKVGRGPTMADLSMQWGAWCEHGTPRELRSGGAPREGSAARLRGERAGRSTESGARRRQSWQGPPGRRRTGGAGRRASAAPRRASRPWPGRRGAPARRIRPEEHTRAERGGAKGAGRGVQGVRDAPPSAPGQEGTQDASSPWNGSRVVGARERRGRAPPRRSSRARRGTQAIGEGRAEPRARTYARI